jgi:hypothetical protein
MSRKSAIPRLVQGLNPSRFKIIPLDVEGNPTKSLIQSRSEFVSLLTSASAKGQKVAIQDEHGMFISCGIKFAPTNSTPAQYGRRIGGFEQFQIEHCYSKGTFAFRSHNNLRLDYIRQLGIVAFKQRTMEEATWMIHPLGFSSGEKGSEHIIFVGVADQNGTFLVERVAEGVGPEWKTDLERIIECIFKDLPDGSCSVFQHPITNHQWTIAKYDAEKVAILVSSENFPYGLASECHDELTLVYKNSIDSKRVKNMEERGLDRDRIVGKELAGLMLEYDEQYYASVRNAKLSKAEQDIQELQKKMGENIKVLQSNTENIEDLTTKSNELLVMSKQFKKQTEKLPTHWKRATMLAGTGLGAGTGALVGWLIGGPGGALILASEGAEIAAVAAAAGIMGGAIGANRTVSFWSRRFVKFAFPK